ncbi:hypothetical protein [Streptomyces zaomyceticus]|uniref:hypothetical protein n=1 Tax=Streptomyces zaomyceticus TaxID=68286 RepID=UPI0034250731
MPAPASDMTVRHLIDRLAVLDPDTPVRLAINPFCPMAHRLADVLVAEDPDGQSVAYLAEDPEAVQYGYLPRPVAEALTWMPPVDPPTSSRRRLRAVSPDRPYDKEHFCARPRLPIRPTFRPFPPGGSPRATLPVTTEHSPTTSPPTSPPPAGLP